MIEFINVTKKYGDKVAVDDISFTVPDGKIVGFIGANGAGKTTTIKMMTGILQPDKGKVLLNNFDISEDSYLAKKQFGYVPDSPDMFLRMRAIDYINFCCDIYEVPTLGRVEMIEQLAKEFHIENSLFQRVVDFSHGMRQKLHIITVLLYNPSIWILDEPMVGLDPETAYLLKQKIKEHAAKGNSVFFSTHVLSLAEDLCDEIIIIKDGQLQFSGKLNDFKKNKNKTLEEEFLALHSEVGESDATITE